MAINSEAVRKVYSGDGSTTSFSFPYPFQDATDFDVYLVDEDGAESLQAFVTDYDVTTTNPDYSDGGFIEFVTAPTADDTVVIIRNVPSTQDTSLTNNASYQSSVLETALDKIVLMVQYLFDRSDRSVRLGEAFHETFDTTLPETLTADASIAINSTGTGFALGATVSEITSAASYAEDAAASAAEAAASAVLAASFTGAGGIGETSFTIVNNQTSAANVTGLLFNPAAVRSAEIAVGFYRNTTGGGATEMSARMKYLATYKTVAGTWELAPLGGGGDFDETLGMPAGVTLSITSGGQVQYVSSNFTGTAGTSKMTFSASTFAV